MPDTETNETPSFPISITARHMELTDAIRDYAEKKVGGIHFGYPKIIEAKVILDSQPHGHIAEIVIVAAGLPPAQTSRRSSFRGSPALAGQGTVAPQEAATTAGPDEMCSQR